MEILRCSYDPQHSFNHTETTAPHQPPIHHTATPPLNSTTSHQKTHHTTHHPITTTPQHPTPRHTIPTPPPHHSNFTTKPHRRAKRGRWGKHTCTTWWHSTTHVSTTPPSTSTSIGRFIIPSSSLSSSSF